ncbi:hypothetical protein A7982_12159 [Minicystis rosea]|nr:hypothetical protein A7982_12159 [Minicystis rosea]
MLCLFHRFSLPSHSLGLALERALFSELGDDAPEPAHELSSKPSSVRSTMTTPV